MAEVEKENQVMADEGGGPGCLKYTVWTIVVALIAIFVLSITVFVDKVEPWEVGLRYWLISVPPEPEFGDYGVNGDVEEEADSNGWHIVRAGEASEPLRPGYNVIVPFLHEFVKYDCSIQRYDFSPLQVRTVENQDEIDVYATVLYRVNRMMVKELRKTYSNNQEVHNGVGKVARAELEKKLGTIQNTTEFYGDSEKLHEQVERAKEAMNEKFYKQGIHVVDVLLWDFMFKEDIEASIISKVLSEERTRVERQLNDAYLQRAELQKLLAQADAALTVGLAEGEAEARKIDADAYRITVQKSAEGDRLILEAQAEGKGMINSALSGRGGPVYVGLEYAKALEGVELIILPASGEEGLNPLNLDKTIMQIQPAVSGSGVGQ